MIYFYIITDGHLVFANVILEPSPILLQTHSKNQLSHPQKGGCVKHQVMEKGNHKEKILHHAPFGYAYHRIILDKNDKPIDYQFLEVNRSFERLTGLKREEILGKNAREILPGLETDAFDWIGVYGTIAMEGGEKELVEHSQPLNRTFKIHVYSPEKYYFSTIFDDITTEINTREKLQNTEKQLRDQIDEYSAVNEELTSANQKLLNMNLDLQNMTHSLGQSNEQINALVNSIPDMIFVFNREGVFLDCRSPRGEEFILPQEQFLNKKDQDVLPPFLYQLNKKALQDLFATGKLQTYSYSLEVKGEKKHYDARMAMMGKDKALTIVRDITQQKKAEEKNRLLLSIIEKSRDFIGVADADKKVLFVNPAGQKMAGINSDEEALQTKITEYFMPEDLPFVQTTILPTLKKEGHWSGELRLRNLKTRQPIPILYDLFLTHDPNTGKITNISTISRDISELKKTEKKLRESELTFRALFDKGPIGVAYHKMIYDKKGSPVDYLFVDANESYQRLTGVNPQGKRATEAFPGIEKDPFNWIGTFAKVARDGEEIRFQQYLEPNNRWYDCVAYQYKPDHFVAAFMEITEQKLAEEALRKSENTFRLIFEKSPMGILQFNANGIVTECNEYLCRIIKSPRERIIGVDLKKLSNKEIHHAIEEVLAGRPALYEGIFQTMTSKVNTPVRILVNPVLREDGAVEAGIALVEDRTDHVQKEKYEKQIAIARESVRFKQNFLANMSHEIRTPLTGIMGVIEILGESELNTTHREHVQILKNTSENLMEIVNQVLDFSKIEDGKVHLKRIDFNFHEFLHQSVVFYRKLCCEEVRMTLTVQPDVPQWLHADKSRLSQILNNLMSNAIKFTDEGSIHLDVSNVQDDPQQEKTSKEELCIKIAVTDTGIGIDAQKLEGLFRPFAQVDDRDVRRYEGTGLGLSISKQLARLHGGDTGAVSTPGEGSTFWFTFRCGIATGQTSPQHIITPPPPSYPEKLRILLAEDKTINQKVITILLKHMGHRVTLASDGKEVLKIYKSGDFDLILMDIQMPVMDGVAATRSLREKYDKLPPIVGLSANAFEGDREKYMATGMDDYLTKPLRKEAFVEMLGRVFGY